MPALRTAHLTFGRLVPAQAFINSTACSSKTSSSSLHRLHCSPSFFRPSSLVPRISDNPLLGHWDSLPLRLLASTSKMQSFIVISSLAAGALAQTYSATYLPSNAPNQSEQGQAGTNKCGTGHSDTSMCQNAYCECCASLAWSS